MPDRSYDDLEDSPVRVVLAVPITVPVTVPSTAPSTVPSTGPVDVATRPSAPPTRNDRRHIRGPADAALSGLPAPARAPARARHRRPAPSSTVWGTVRRGIVAALVVFGLLGLALMLLDLLVR